jgi:DnaJ-class molecular chaperone
MRTKSKDYYNILRIHENASETEIKKSFRSLAMELHPDRNPDDPGCEEKFKNVTEAYGVLIDPIKRKEYDRHRAGLFTKTKFDDYDFKYSQQDIFENMFRQGLGRDIFEELNKEFNRQGYRSGKTFFAAILFGTAAGKLGRMLAFLPGPIGKIGLGLKLIQAVGTSIYTINKMRNSHVDNNESKTSKNSESSKKKSVFEFFNNSTNLYKSNLDIKFNITIPENDAKRGTKKQLSYSTGEYQENLLVSIPPGTASGCKLRIKDKGRIISNKRGDLIITVDHNVEA